MQISFENPDKVNGLLTMTVEENDFKDDVEKTLKNYRKRANVPGFRPGQVPMGLIKRQFGTSVKVDAINKLIGEQLQKYINDNKIQMLGQPLPHEGQEPVDLEKDAPYTFQFDIAVAPEFEAKLSGRDKVAYYDIKVDDKLIDQQVEMFANRAGHYTTADSYDPEKRDVLKGDLRELDENGNTLEGGITESDESLMPAYFDDEEQKEKFKDAKPGDIITFNPTAAYKGGETQVASLLKIDREKVGEHKGDFSFQVTEVSRWEKAEVNEELWQGIYGKDSGIKDEKGFREAIAKGLAEQLQGDSDFKFLQDVRAHVLKKIGKLQYPDEMLKRILLANNEKNLKTEEDKQKFIDENYKGSLDMLTWDLAKNQLAVAAEIKVDDKDVEAAAEEMARMQFAQYGMSNVPEEYVKNYAKELLKKEETVRQMADRALDQKLIEKLKNVVKLDHKEISLDDFNKMMQEENK
ncbi:MAG: trigger factor [Prevotella sp.]|nr:trigger factor [Prevotella sp.]MDY6318493.1 trigger factor [Prevotella sp.]